MATVKCPYCEKYFNKDKEEYIKIGRRYAHKSCVDSDELWKAKINEKAKTALGSTYSKARVDKQITTFLSEGKTLEGIFLTLEYWYDIKKGSAEKAYGGIGIVPYVYDDAQNYYARQNKIKENISQVDLSQIVVPAENTIVIKPTPIRKPKRMKLFSLN